MEVVRLASEPLDEIIQRKTDEFNEAKENIKDLKRAVEDLEREYIMVRDTMKDLQREAVRITGNVYNFIETYPLIGRNNLFIHPELQVRELEKKIHRRMSRKDGRRKKYLMVLMN